MNITGVPGHTAVEDDVMLTEGVSAVVTVIKILLELTCWGNAQPNEDVITTFTISLSANPEL